MIMTCTMKESSPTPSNYVTSQSGIEAQFNSNLLHADWSILNYSKQAKLLSPPSFSYRSSVQDPSCEIQVILSASCLLKKSWVLYKVPRNSSIVQLDYFLFVAEESSVNGMACATLKRSYEFDPLLTPQHQPSPKRRRCIPLKPSTPPPSVTTESHFRGVAPRLSQGIS